jgi:hypothetical protein
MPHKGRIVLAAVVHVGRMLRGLRIVPIPTPATRWFPFRVTRHQLTRGFPVLLSELGYQNELAASKSYVFSHYYFSNYMKA